LHYSSYVNIRHSKKKVLQKAGTFLSLIRFTSKQQIYEKEGANMKRKTLIALLISAIITFGTVGVFALDYYVPENANSMTARFFLSDMESPGDGFAMVSEDGVLLIHIHDGTIVYFEDYVPLDDYGTGVTRMAREILFGRTLAEVLEGRNLRVLFGVSTDTLPRNTSPISVEILFESIALPLPEPIEWDGLDYSESASSALEPAGFTPIFLNGEIVVNNEIIEDAPAAVLHSTKQGLIMIPLRAVAEALDYDVRWNEDSQSIQLGVATHIWIGSTEAHRGRMAPIELSTAPVIMEGTTFVPIDFFREVLGQTVYVFEGQVVIETYSDMM